MTDAAIISKADRKAANVAAHQARNEASRKTAQATRAAAAELHRERNAEVHYAAVAAKAMKKAQDAVQPAPVASNDDAPLARAA